MEKRYGQKLDIYYMAAVAYLVTLIVYAVIAGSLIGEHFQLLWKDPIVYLLALCAVVSVVALIVAAVLNKQVVIKGDEMLFITRSKTRTLHPNEIEWVSFRRGSRGKIRGDGTAERAVRIKLKNRRRRLWLRPALFNESEEMVADLRNWMERNSVPIRVRKGRRGFQGKGGTR
ncbi:MAG: hypothetical protein AB7H80_04775 [Candidatus Kapaibacterium sp.]